MAPKQLMTFSSFFIKPLLQTNQIYKINLTTKTMSSSTIVSNTPNQVYGFLCQTTKIFYAFESFEQYQVFLEWMQRESGAAS